LYVSFWISLIRCGEILALWPSVCLSSVSIRALRQPKSQSEVKKGTCVPVAEVTWLFAVTTKPSGGS